MWVNIVEPGRPQYCILDT